MLRPEGLYWFGLRMKNCFLKNRNEIITIQTLKVTTAAMTVEPYIDPSVPQFTVLSIDCSRLITPEQSAALPTPFQTL